MDISVTCQGCATNYLLGEHVAGKKARCNQCGTVMRVPALVAAGQLAGAGDSDQFGQVAESTPRRSPLLPRPVPSPVIPRGLDVEQLVYARAARKRLVTPPLEICSPILTGLFVLANLAVVALGLFQYYTTDASLRAALPVGKGLGLTLAAVAGIFLFFAIVAPMVLAGIVLAGRTINFDLADGAYLKAAGLAAIPAIARIGLGSIPPNPAVTLAAVAGSSVLAFYLLKFVFGLDRLCAIVAFAFGVILYVIASYITTFLVAGVLLPRLVTSA